MVMMIIFIIIIKFKIYIIFVSQVTFYKFSYGTNSSNDKLYSSLHHING